MKLHFSVFQGTARAVALCGILCGVNPGYLRAAGDIDPAEQVRKSSILFQPLKCVGAVAPSKEDSQFLVEQIDIMKGRGAKEGIPALKRFAVANPSSPWTPSILANLGRYHAEHGRFTEALAEYEEAWKATCAAADGPAKQVADFTFAHWTQLLASLGQVEKLRTLFKETEGRIFDGGPLQQIVNSSRSMCASMIANSEYSFRCGTYALNNVAKVLNRPGHDELGIREIPSPVTGFSLAKLAELAETQKLGLVAAEWGGERVPVVPCVVHWKQNHYSAIVSGTNGIFKVVDPSFKKPLQMTLEDIQREASGSFLVPKEILPKDWTTLAASRTDSIFGKGFSANVNDWQDGCANGSGGGSPPGTGSGAPEVSPMHPCTSCGTGGKSGNSASSGGGGAGCPTCSGSGRGGNIPGPYISNRGGNEVHAMPVWEVSEPYINVWLYDEPLGYQPGLGYRISFKLSYKQRETREHPANLYSIGGLWNCSWVTMMRFDVGGSFEYPMATLLAPNGGEQNYSDSYYLIQQGEAFSYNRSEWLFDENQNWMGCIIHKSNGDKDYYDYLPANVSWDTCPVALITRSETANGHATRFEYETINGNVLLKRVIDADGRTNTLTYADATHPTHITGVQDPFNHSMSLQYNSLGQITNVVDVISMASSFQYDVQGWVTNMTTPYGSTRFEYYAADPEIVNEQDQRISRAVRIVDPVGGTNIYMYRPQCSYQTNSLGEYIYFDFGLSFLDESLVPENLPEGVVWNGYLNFRNSFHWGPKQAAGLPSDYFQYTVNDYYKARMRHWLHWDYNVISHALEMERSPSPDLDGHTPGWTTWFRSCQQFVGHEFNPMYFARRLPDGTTQFTWYRYDEWGRATNVVESCSSGFGASIQMRTNSYIYEREEWIYVPEGSTNVDRKDLLAVFGPNGELERGYAYDDNHNVLRMTNALNEVTFYTYDADGRLTSVRTPAGLTTTNIYYTSGSYAGWLEKTIDIEIQRTNSYTYNNGLVATHTDERGFTTSYTYDALQRVVRIDFPDTTYITNSYDKLDLVKTVDRMGFPTTFGYDAVRRKTAVTNALGNYTLYGYCPCGGLENVRDAAGNYTSYTYDNAGRTTYILYPDNYAVNMYYDCIGRVTNQTDTAGMNTTFWYNNQGLRYAVSNSFGLVQFTAYDIEDHATNTVDANGVSINTTFDDLGRAVARSYPDGGVEKFVYSERGLVAYTNQLGKATCYSYDEARRKITEINANTEVTWFTNSPAGDLVSLTDGKNQITRWQYDSQGRVTNKWDTLNTNMFSYKYDADGRLTNRWTPAKGTTAYRYDDVGNLTYVDYTNSPDITLRYDSMNRLTNMVDAVGSTTYAYNSASQLLSEDGPWANDTVSSTYTERLRTGLALVHPSESPWVQSYSYDSMKRLTDIVSPAGAFGYSYSVDGNPSPSSLVRKLSLPGGNFITNTFDNVSRMTGTTLKTAANSVVNSHGYGYNVGNQRTQQVFTAGNTMKYGYDAIGQLKTARGSESGGATRWHELFGYTYDASGNVNYRTNNLFLQTFRVNELNQLTNISRASSGYTVSGTTTRTATSVTVNSQTADRYADAMFARTNLSLSDGQNTFTAVAQDSYGRTDTNSVIAWLPASVNCVYDQNGNMTGNGRRSFAYDDENQLIQVLVTNASGAVTKSDFAYDGKMRRRVRTESALSGVVWVTNLVVRYVYDGNLVMQERHFAPQLSQMIPQLTVNYTRGRDLSGSLAGAGGIGGLLARSDLSNLQSPHALYHADGNGNVTCLIGLNGVMLAQYEYDPFGSVQSQAGFLAEANLYRFSSKEFHANSGLIYYLYRYYEPGMQRWVNRDPLADFAAERAILLDLISLRLNASSPFQFEMAKGANVYQFACNNPILKQDAWGLFVSVENPIVYPKGPFACDVVPCKWACRFVGIGCAGLCELFTAGWGSFWCMASCALAEQACEDQCP